MEIRVQSDTNGLGLPTVVAHSSRDLAAVAFVVRQPGAPSTTSPVCCSRDQGRTWTRPGWCRGPATTRSPSSRSWRSTRPAGSLSAFAYRRGLIEVVVLVAVPRPPASAGRPVTSRPFDPAQGTLSGKHGAWWIGDYQGWPVPPAGSSVLERLRTGRLELFTTSLH